MTLTDLLERRINDWKTGRSRRRVLVLDDLRAGYIPIAKVASTSLRLHLCRRQARLFYPDEAAQDPRTLQKCMEKRIRKTLGVDETRRLATTHFLFAFVRNPITRLYSCYLDKVVKAARLGEECRLRLYGLSSDMSLDEFVRCIAEIPDAQSDQHFRSQHLYVRADNEWLVQFLGKFERLNADWARLSTRLALDEIPAIQRSTGAGSALAKVPMKRETARIAVDRYREDIETLGYADEIEEWLRSFDNARLTSPRPCASTRRGVLTVNAG